MIDLHSHIIWNVDDGSKTEEMTLNMLKAAEKAGTKKIIATPHYFRGSYECTYSEISDKLKELKKLAVDNNIDIEILGGQEVYYTENIMKYYTDGEIGTLNDTKYMLIELPMDKFSREEVVNNLYELTIIGVKPVIAHPERYRPFINDPTLINKFIKEGYLFQLNTGSINGYFGKEVKKTAETFIENKIYNFIGSDAHRDTGRSIDMNEAVENIEKITEGYSKEIFKSSQRLIDNEDIKFLGKLVEKKKKGLFSFFSR